MSVYKQGDQRRDDPPKEEKKKDFFDEVGEEFDKLGNKFSKMRPPWFTRVRVRVRVRGHQDETASEARLLGSAEGAPPLPPGASAAGCARC